MKWNSVLAKKPLRERFRGFLPVIVDIETSGIDPYKNALLEMCVVFIQQDEAGNFSQKKSFFEHILPFNGAELDQKSLAFIGVDPFHPLRFAIEEKDALHNLFQCIFKEIHENKCQRAVLVGHNAWFDLLFIKAALKRTGLTSPFHDFTCFDTATLGGMFYGQTVLAKALKAAAISFDTQCAHSAIYDAEKTADLFCTILNTWHQQDNAMPQKS